MVESLQGGDFKSGQLVSYFLEIDVDTAAIEQGQAIQVKLGFLASTTGQEGVGQDWIQNIQVNYASERVTYDGDGTPATKTGPNTFVDNPITSRTNVTDIANLPPRNDGGSYAVLVEQGFESRDGIVFTGGNTLNGQPAISNTFGPIANVNYNSNGNDGYFLYEEQMARLYTVFNVYDLDPGEKPVVRIDVHLGDDGQKPTGNLQGFLLDAQVISPTAGTTTINAGRQTIPFKLTKDLRLEPPSYGLSFEKYVTTDIAGYDTLLQTANFNNANALTFFNNNKNEEATIIAGDSVVYLYKITNTGSTNLIDLFLVDDSNNGNNNNSNPLIKETFTARIGSGNTAGQFLNLAGQVVSTAEEAAQVFANDILNNTESGNEISLLTANGNPPFQGLASGTTGTTRIILNETEALGGLGGTNASRPNDLAPGKSLIVAYQVQLNNVQVVENEAVAAYSIGTNGGGQKGNLIGAVDTAKVNVLPAGAGLAGFVYNDANNDGTKQSTEQGIAGVLMTLTNGTNTFTTRTNSSGLYQFTGIADGTYTLTETQPNGFLDGKDAKVGTQAQNGTFANQPVTGNDTVSGIVINSAIPQRNYNFGEIRPATISGMAYFDLNNNQANNTNETGRSGVTITLTGTNDLSQPVTRTITTDSSGRYLFEGLRPGTYQLTGDGTENVGSLGGATDANLSKINNIVINSGNAGINYDFGVAPTLGSVSGTVYQDTDNNGAFALTGSRDKALVGVQIKLFNSSGVEIATTRTDARGNYTFNNLPDGTYKVVETQPQYFDPNINKGEGGFVQYLNGFGQNGNNEINNISVSSGSDVTGNNFGEVPPASISGYTYIDVSSDAGGRNQEFDADDTPLGGVVIQLFTSSNTATPFATTTTDATGYYEFSSLANGMYRLVQVQPSISGLTSDGEEVGSTDLTESNGANGDNTDNQIEMISLTFGEGGQDYNFREVVTGAIIQGFVYEDNNDNGIFENGVEAGISGVTIELLDGTSTVQTTTTDADGKYVFLGVDNSSAITYTIEQTQPAGYNDGKDSFDDGFTTTVIDGSKNTDTISVSVNTTDSIYKDYIFGEIKLGNISGTVLEDTDGAGTGANANLSGVTVNLKQGETLIATTTTDANGNYTFNNVINGSYTIEQVNLDNTYFDVSDVEGANDSLINVTISGGQTSSGNNFVDERKGIISGNVKEDINGNGNGDNNLSGVKVNLKQGETLIATTTTDANGNYTFNNVINGSYTIEQVNLDNTYFDVSDVEGANDSLINVTISSGQTSSGNNFVDERKGIISGQVLNDADNDNEFSAGDTPINDVTIELLNSSGNVIASTVTDGNGNYSFAGVANGNYTIRQTQPANYNSIKEVDGDNDNSIAVTISGGNSVSGQNFLEKLQPAPSASISGTVLEDRTGNGFTGDDVVLRNVLVTLSNATGVVATARTDNDGKYTFSGLNAGTYSVTQTNLTSVYLDVTDADGNINGKSKIDVTLAGGQNVTGRDFLDIRLGEIRGRVFDDTNKNDQFDLIDPILSGVTVELINSSGETIASQTTDSTGNYRFTNVYPDTYTVKQTNLTGYEDVTDIDGDFNNNGSSVVQVQIVSALVSGNNNFLDRIIPSSISGFVFDDTNRNNDFGGDTPLSDVTVQLFDSNNNLVATTITGSTGAYSFDKLNPGTYTVKQVNLSGYTDVKTTNANNNNEIPVTLTPGTNSSGNNFLDTVPLNSIFGSVFDDTNDTDTLEKDNDTPLNGVLIELFTGTDTTGTPTRSTTTNANGDYSFTDLANGTYTVKQTNLPGYSDVTGFDNEIDVTLNNASSFDNDFLDKAQGLISGTVFSDFNNNGVINSGTDEVLSGVTVNLFLDGNVIRTATTDGNGFYEFTGLNAGNYTIQKNTLPNFGNVTDIDGVADNRISVNLPSADTQATSQDFLDVPLGNIQGFVYVDTDDDGIKDSGEVGIKGVLVDLYLNGTTYIKTSATNNDGLYEFTGLKPGDYKLQQRQQPVGYNDGLESRNDVLINGTNNGTDVIDQLLIPAGINDNRSLVNNNFGEIAPSAQKNIITGTDGRDTITKKLA